MEAGASLNFGTPTEPRPAASVLLLRRGGTHPSRGLEVLLGRRTSEARFMPGAWVFPGGAVDPGDGPLDPDGTAHRACAIRELAEEVAIELPPETELILHSRWITPEVLRIRFDAWFFLALAPRHSPPRPDGTETVDAAWFAPAEALRASEAGELELSFPTVRQLRQLGEFRTSEEAIEAARGRAVETILPKPVETDEGVRITLPGDDDYPA